MAALDAAEIRPPEARRPAPEDPASVRKFLLKLALFVSVWGALFFRGEWTRYAVWLTVWAMIIGVGLVLPAPFRPLRRAAHRLGALVGRLLAWLALAVIYYLVLTPVALVARLTGKRFLDLGRDPSAATYWQARTDDADRAGLECQF